MARSNTGSSSNRFTTATASVTAAPLTMACWFNPANLVENYNLVFLSNSAFSNYFGLIFDGNNVNGQGDNVVLADASSGADAYGVSPTGGTAGAWNHAAAVFASATSRTAYLNGAGGTANTTSKTPASLTVTNVGGISTFWPLNGSMAEVGIWNVALTAAEILQLSKGCSPLLVRPNNLIRYWPLMGVGTETCRISGETLTVTGTMAKAAHAPILEPRLPVLGMSGGTVAGVGTATGTGAANGVGAAASSAVGTTAGTGAASGVGKAASSAVGSASGTGAASGVASGTSAAIGTTAGTGTANGVASGTSAAIGTSAGVGTASGTGQAASATVGATAGVGAASGVASSASSAVGTASGAGSASGVASATSAVVGTSAGTSTADGVGVALGAGSVGTASGSSTASGVGAADSASIGTSAGTSTMSGVGDAVSLRTDRGGDGGSPVRNRRKYRHETRDQLQKLLETTEEEPGFTPEQVTAIKEEIVQSIEAGGLLGPVKAPVAEFVQRELQQAFVPGMDWAAIRQTVAFITARAAEEAERLETEIEEEDIMLLLLAA